MKESMQVAILAGGLGTRLRPITEKVPKPMVPVAGEPFLHWQLSDLREQGFRRVMLLVAYLGEQVERHFGDGHEFGLELEYCFEPEPLGTGGALKNALPKLDPEFVLLNGDSFLKAPLDEMVRAFHAGGFDAMVSVYDNHDPVPVIPNLKVHAGRVLEYEKDAGLARGFDRIDSGIYVLKRTLLERRAENRFMLADLWPQLNATGRLGAFDVNERFYDIGTIERLKEFEEKVRDYFPHSFTR
jgi:NDP-sugar pyrophosphorylase family protein